MDQLSQRDEELRYNEVAMIASHNSCCTDASNSVLGDITTQLSLGSRLAEFDFHASSVRDQGCYTLGHNYCGQDIGVRGATRHHIRNPVRPVLRTWLEQLAGWCRQHEGHLPITVLLDVKDSLVAGDVRYSYSTGNLSRLNELILAVFGDLLFTHEDLLVYSRTQAGVLSPAQEARGAGQSAGSLREDDFCLVDDEPLRMVWPTLAEMRSKVLVVLSGDVGTRVAYRRDNGRMPALGASQSGQYVVGVHQAKSRTRGHSNLWYWAGCYDASANAVAWTGHGLFASTGAAPAVAVHASGAVVAVYESPSGALSYRLGQMCSRPLAAEGTKGATDIMWVGQETQLAAKGSRPCVAIDDASGAVVVVYETGGNEGSYLSAAVSFRTQRSSLEAVVGRLEAGSQRFEVPSLLFNTEEVFALAGTSSKGDMFNPSVTFLHLPPSTMTGPDAPNVQVAYSLARDDQDLQPCNLATRQFAYGSVLAAGSLSGRWRVQWQGVPVDARPRCPAVRTSQVMLHRLKTKLYLACNSPGMGSNLGPYEKCLVMHCVRSSGAKSAVVRYRQLIFTEVQLKPKGKNAELAKDPELLFYGCHSNDCSETFPMDKPGMVVRYWKVNGSALDVGSGGGIQKRAPRPNFAATDQLLDSSGTALNPSLVAYLQAENVLLAPSH